MTHRVRVSIGMIALLIVAGVAALLFLRGNREATLVFRLRDAVSTGWVWDATVSIQNRSMRLFYQSDDGPVPLVFTGLRTGRHTLEISAPHYDSRALEVDLSPGRNQIDHPVELQGTSIPDLSQFGVSVRPDRGSLNIQLRPIASDGTAIVKHPALDLAIGVVLSDQIDVSGGRVRGTTRFIGFVDWTWTNEPGAAFRYNGVLPLDQLSGDLPETLVLESVVIVENYADDSEHDLQNVTEQIDMIGSDIQRLGTRLLGAEGVDVFFPAPVWGIELR